MKTLKLDFDITSLTLSPESPEKELPTTAKLTERVLFLVARVYSEQKRGLTKPERTLYYQFREIIEKAVKENLKEAIFPDDVFGFIRKVFREAKIPLLDNTIEFVEKNIDAVKMD